MCCYMSICVLLSDSSLLTYFPYSVKSLLFYNSLTMESSIDKALGSIVITTYNTGPIILSNFRNQCIQLVHFQYC